MQISYDVLSIGNDARVTVVLAKCDGRTEKVFDEDKRVFYLNNVEPKTLDAVRFRAGRS